MEGACMSKTDTIDEIFDLYKAAITNDSGTAWEQEERISEAKAAHSAMVAEILGATIEPVYPGNMAPSDYMKAYLEARAKMIYQLECSQRAIAKGFTL
jgi:hypothetical protein